jgi:hypothetical protein
MAHADRAAGRQRDRLGTRQDRRQLFGHRAFNDAILRRSRSRRAT